jgi:hypothetical protein
LIGITATTGWLTYSGPGDVWEEWHEAGANLLRGWVVMFIGRKRSPAAEGNRPAHHAPADDD